MANVNSMNTYVNVRVRRANDNDLDAIYEVETLSFKNPYPRTLLEFYLNLHNDLFLVAEVNNRVVGYIIGVIRWRIIGHILSIAVHPEFRRRGIGSKLLMEEELMMKSKGVKVVRLEVRKSNEPAIRMYTRLGYLKAFVKPCYYEDGEDAYVMFKVL